MEELKANRAADTLLSELAYPMAKDELMRRAREADLPQDALDAFAALPEREYEDAADVARELNAT